MLSKWHSCNLVLHSISCVARAALVIMSVLMVVLNPLAQSQNYQVIHYFSWQPGGIYPLAGLTVDAAGNLYGVTGNLYGSVYKLTPQGSGWVFTPLYTFNQSDGENGADANVVFGPDGNLYGTATGGGHWVWEECGAYGCGLVWEITH